MTISVVLPRALTPYSSGTGTLRLDGTFATVADALAAVASQWPAVTDRVLTEQGELRRHVNVFLGEENVRFLDGLRSPVSNGETITIVAAVSGG